MSRAPARFTATVARRHPTFAGADGDDVLDAGSRRAARLEAAARTAVISTSTAVTPGNAATAARA